jgi:hypothetical protein
MRSFRNFVVSPSVLCVISACGGAAESNEPNDEHGSELLAASEDPPMLGVHHARKAAHKASRTATDMTWHNGAILESTAIKAIFWGSKWGTASFVGDKTTGIDSFYSGLGGSTYASTNTEYTGTNGTVGTAVDYHGHVVDTSSAPKHAPPTSAVLGEVCRMISSPVVNGYYPVYTDTRRGGAQYCAWHSYGTCSGVPIQFGFFFDLDGDSGCDPQDASGLHSQGLAAIANVSGHEYSETITDPRNGGWFDSSNDENADKCAWTFGGPLVTFTNGSEWKVQGNWSNAAFDKGSGYPNASGQKGCLGGN